MTIEKIEQLLENVLKQDKEFVARGEQEAQQRLSDAKDSRISYLLAALNEVAAQALAHARRADSWSSAITALADQFGMPENISNKTTRAIGFLRDELAKRKQGVEFDKSGPAEEDPFFASVYQNRKDGPDTWCVIGPDSERTGPVFSDVNSSEQAAFFAECLNEAFHDGAFQGKHKAQCLVKEIEQILGDKFDFGEAFTHDMSFLNDKTNFSKEWRAAKQHRDQLLDKLKAAIDSFKA